MNYQDAKVIFMGTTDISAKVLQCLIDNGYNVVALIAQQDRPVGRKKIIEPINVQLGDVLRWNYTGEEGVEVGFDYEEGVRKFIVRQNDGTEIR